MPRRISRLSVLLAAVLSSCGGDGNPFQPLHSGTSLPVTLETTIDQPSGTLPRFEITAISGGARLQWDVVSAPCLLSEASALQSGPVIEVRIHRSGNPLALCAATVVAYHYVARVLVPAPGHYEVRLVEDLLGQPLRPVGRGTVAVAPAL